MLRQPPPTMQATSGYTATKKPHRMENPSAADTRTLHASQPVTNPSHEQKARSRHERPLAPQQPPQTPGYSTKPRPPLSVSPFQPRHPFERCPPCRCRSCGRSHCTARCADGHEGQALHQGMSRSTRGHPASPKETSKYFVSIHKFCEIETGATYVAPERITPFVVN